MKIALISGTSTGIGLALATALLARGWQVHGIGRSSPGSLQNHPDYRHFICDLSDLEKLPKAMARFLADRPGLKQIDLVCLNSGQFCEAMRRISETPVQELLQLQALNCFSAKLILDALIGADLTLPLCLVSASIAGKRARAGNGGYALSKATLNMMMELYALEHPETFFAVIGLCAVDTFLSNKIATLSLPDNPVFTPQALLRARAVTPGYVATPDQRAAQLLSLLVPGPDPRLASGQFVEVRSLVS
ncbi:SDR family NAD(P)-dependent oxidoreductase [Paracoccus aminophilus]|uniref:Short-chain dehydrogenase/reductase SDR n=1 Tax=Paracoccus aminophilus JCM 7686 TaxID=1367847 RepID=S5XNC7_PARAH|nr:SDR family NAD(P)-dependent oxidoreductase [Paracoccus aminophilus]AGT08824.1 short-chain dehydrogenase/reductase SDR [Paracoccus aminophilus JCM 7686]